MPSDTARQACKTADAGCGRRPFWIPDVMEPWISVNTPQGRFDAAARAHDLERADQLVVTSINELTLRHGSGPMASSLSRLHVVARHCAPESS